MKILVIKIFLCIFITVLLISCKKAAIVAPSVHTVTLQPVNGNDVSVFDFNPNDGTTDTFKIAAKNYYGYSILYINQHFTFESNTRANTLLKFDSLSFFPTSTKIITSKLYLFGVDSTYLPVYFYVNQVAGGGNSFYGGLSDRLAHLYYNTNADTAFNNAVLAEPINSNWDAHTVTYHSMPSSNETTLFTINASTSRWNYNVTLDITELVQHWVQSPLSNFGLSLQIANTYHNTPGIFFNHQMVFYSSSAYDPSRHPKLIIQYQ